MKRILTFLFSLLAVAGLRAAIPALTDFRGTNEVNVVTNSSTKKVLIGPAVPISTTASNAAQSIANNYIATDSGNGTNNTLVNVTLVSAGGNDVFDYSGPGGTPAFNKSLRINTQNQTVFFDTGGGVSWGPAGGSVLQSDGGIDLNTNVRLSGVNGGANFGGTITGEVNLIIMGNSLLAGVTNNGSFTNSGNIYNNGSITNGGVASSIGFASYSTTGTNQIGTTGYTNNGVINQTVYVTATAVSFTIKNRSGTVLYTSPTLTATLPVNLQPGWAVNAASGLTGTALPF